MSLFKNASPEYILLGANDKGSRPLPTARDAVPQHVPLVYMFTQKGSPKKFLSSGAAAIANFGAETFNADSPYFKHTTKLAESMFGAGNVCMQQRLIPTDAGIKSNIVVYADISKTQVPNYVRNSFGDKVIDTVTNLPAVDTATPTISGTEIKFITEVSQDASMGTAAPKPGTMVSNTGVTSTMYPVFEFRAAAQGMYYNNIGFSIESVLTANVDTAVITAAKALPYRLGLVYRNDAASSPQTLRSLYGEPSVQFTLKDGVKHPVTTLKIDMKSVFADNWFNETDPLKTIRYNDYENLYVYYTYLDSILAGIMADEKSYVSDVAATWADGLVAPTLGWFDYTTANQTTLDTETYLINLFTAKSTSGKDYFTLVPSTATPVLAAGQKEVHLSKSTPIFMDGGSDGTMDNAMFESLVNVEMAKYLDPNSEVIDNAINVETHLYDSGFTLATKQNLLNFIGVRKDTLVALGTHDAANKATVMSLADTRAIAVLLQVKAKLFPESDFFGTPVARAVIMGGAYKLYSDLNGDYFPTTFELAIKSARMMSAGNYLWKATYNFDHGPAAVLKYGFGYKPEFIPAGIKPTLWNSGMVWAQPKDRSTYFIPAVQTVYDDDTSPMNTWYTVCGLVTLNRIASDAWREFTGTSTMNDAEFKEVVLNYLNTRLQGIFDGLLIVVPEVIISAADAQRGYSWQVMFKLYSGNMKTKMVSYTEVYRLNDLIA